MVRLLRRNCHQKAISSQASSMDLFLLKKKVDYDLIRENFYLGTIFVCRWLHVELQQTRYMAMYSTHITNYMLLLCLTTLQ